MATNGRRKPPRPRIEMLTDASETEAAAVAAALELFLAETAPPPSSSGQTQSPWQRAGLREGVSRSDPLAWGPPFRIEHPLQPRELGGEPWQ